MTRALPHDLEAETAVLGSILLESSSLMKVLDDHLEPEHFSNESNGHIYRAALNLFRKGEPIDHITLAGELERLGTLDVIGGRAKLALLQESVPTAANAAWYGGIVKELASKRKLIAIGAEVTALGYEEAVSGDEAVNQAQAKVYGISDERTSGNLNRLYDLLRPAMDSVDAQMADPNHLRGIPSGHLRAGVRVGSRMRTSHRTWHHPHPTTSPLPGRPTSISPGSGSAARSRGQLPSNLSTARRGSPCTASTGCFSEWLGSSSC